MSGLIPSIGRTVCVASTSRAAAFSTSAAVQAADKAKTMYRGSFRRAKSKMNITKGSGRRIVAHRLKLTSDLAQPAPDMTDLVQLYPESIIAENVGKPSVIPRKTLDALQTFGLPKQVDKDLTIGAPTTVIRKETLDLVQALDNAKEGSSKDSRYMITGERGSGKSMLLLQAVANAMEAGWIVLYQPKAVRWVDSSSQYGYNKEKMAFEQPEAAVEMLQALFSVNRKRLSQIKLEQDVKLADGTVAAGQGLDKLVEHGLKEGSTTAIPTLEAVLAALGAQTQFPVLLAIDEAQTLFNTTQYRAPDNSLLEAYYLGMPRIALEFLSGASEFKRGAVVTATSCHRSDFPISDSLIAGLGLPENKPLHAYTPLDETYVRYASSGIKRFDLPFGMSGHEAAGMFEVFSRKGWTSNSTDDVFMGGFTAAMGNPKEMHRSWRESHQSFISQAALPAFYTTPTTKQ